jgi:hypothetical protein
MLQKVQFRYENRPRGWLSALKVLPRGKVVLAAGAKLRFYSQGVELRSQTYRIFIELASKALDPRKDLRVVAFNQAECEL